MTDQVESKTQKGIEDKKKLCKLDDDDEYDYITVPPDGGFGWVVLIACFVSDYFKCILHRMYILSLY
jgi:hypothetical protein